MTNIVSDLPFPLPPSLTLHLLTLFQASHSPSLPTLLHRFPPYLAQADIPCHATPSGDALVSPPNALTPHITSLQYRCSHHPTQPLTLHVFHHGMPPSISQAILPWGYLHPLAWTLIPPTRPPSTGTPSSPCSVSDTPIGSPHTPHRGWLCFT